MCRSQSRTVTSQRICVFCSNALFVREYPPVSELTFLSENREGQGLIIIGNPEISNYSLQQR